MFCNRTKYNGRRRKKQIIWIVIEPVPVYHKTKFNFISVLCFALLCSTLLLSHLSHLFDFIRFYFILQRWFFRMFTFCCLFNILRSHNINNRKIRWDKVTLEIKKVEIPPIFNLNFNNNKTKIEMKCFAFRSHWRIRTRFKNIFDVYGLRQNQFYAPHKYSKNNENKFFLTIIWLVNYRL